MMDLATDTASVDHSQRKSQFHDDVLAGLRAEQRRLPCKYFYDHRGSALFDQICHLDEYYLTRTESEIMRRYSKEMADQIGQGVRLVEYGSGSSWKTRLLLDSLPSPVAYVPIDISQKHLSQISEDLQRDYARIEILPVATDFTKDFTLPEPSGSYTHTAVYFPGSTIGNFQPDEVAQLLQSIALHCGNGGGLLIGIDLEKDPEIIESAYNDHSGITSEFNLNLLHRLRNELNAEIDLSGFEHHAFYDQEHARVEIYIRSLRDQEIVIDGESFSLSEGELIHTEYSHKYTIDRFSKIAARAGLTLRRSWTDDRQLFAVLHLAVLDEPA